MSDVSASSLFVSNSLLHEFFISQLTFSISSYLFVNNFCIGFYNEIDMLTRWTMTRRCLPCAEECLDWPPLDQELSARSCFLERNPWLRALMPHAHQVHHHRARCSQ
jgi:hypothetical protein